MIFRLINKINDWSEELQHQKLLRQIKREKEIEQAMCNHKFEYVGVHKTEYYTVVDVDFYSRYRIKCSLCGTVESYELKENALLKCK